MAWSFFKKKPPHRRPCPRCGVEDAKNGVFCFHCGAQILQTAILSPASQRPGFTLPLWLSRILALLVVLAILLGLLWFVGNRLPFDPTRLTGLQVLGGDGYKARGTLLPRLSAATGSFKIVGNLLFAPPSSETTVKVFDARKTVQRWKRSFPTRFLFHRIVLRVPSEGEAPLVPGKYKLQVSRGERVLDNLAFVVE